MGRLEAKKIEHLTERYGKEAGGRKTDVRIIVMPDSQDGVQRDDDASADMRERSE